jgi:hypothetical protein
MLTDEQAGRMLADRRTDKADCAYQRAFGCTRFDGARISALLLATANNDPNNWKLMNWMADRWVRTGLHGDELCERLADWIVEKFGVKQDA